MRTQTHTMRSPPHSNPFAPQRLPRSERRDLLRGLSGRPLAVRVVDLCCGMGGLSVAARDMGMRVVAGVDVNPSALRTFSRNFPEAEAIEGSVRSGTVLERCRAEGCWQ